MVASVLEELTMSVNQLIPWNRGTGSTGLSRSRSIAPPVFDEMDRIFDDLWSRLAIRSPAAATGWPRLEMFDTDDTIEIVAELPGVRHEDVEVSVEGDVLVLRGERREERTDTGRRLSEIRYGRFERAIALEAEVVADDARAEFRDGLLRVSLPKHPQVRRRTVRVQVAKA